MGCIAVVRPSHLTTIARFRGYGSRENRRENLPWTAVASLAIPWQSTAPHRSDSAPLSGQPQRSDQVERNAAASDGPVGSACTQDGGGVIEDALTKLDLLVRFRNAVAHGNESELAGIVASGDIKPTLASYRQYQRTVNRLLGIMDRVVATELAAVLQVPPPW